MFSYYDVCVQLMCDIVAKCGKGKILSTMALLQLGVELLLGGFHNLQVVTLATIEMVHDTTYEGKFMSKFEHSSFSNCIHPNLFSYRTPRLLV